jgi:hypothetical protein
MLQLHARSHPDYQEPLVFAEIEGPGRLPANLAGPKTQRRVVEAADPIVDPGVGEQGHGYILAWRESLRELKRAIGFFLRP